MLVQAPEGPNINQNLLPTHAEANILELIYDGKESSRSYNPIVKIQTIEEKSVNLAESLKAMSLSQEGIGEDKAQESTKKPLITVQGARGNVDLSQDKPKLTVVGALSQPILTVKGVLAPPIVLKPVTQPPIVDTKKVPWNYGQTVMTYHGKEVVKDVDEVGV